MEKVYGTPKNLIHEIIQSLIAMPGIHIIHEVDLDLLLKYWPEKIPDFGDSIVACICKKHNGSAILTFDKKFKVLFGQLGLVSAF